MHSELCTCRDCVQTYEAVGQTDPYGFPVRVEWSVDDGIAHAEWLEYPEYIGEHVTDEVRAEMAALVRRIEGRRFDDVRALVTYLREVTGSRDFD